MCVCVCERERERVRERESECVCGLSLQKYNVLHYSVVLTEFSGCVCMVLKLLNWLLSVTYILCSIML